MRRSAFTLLEVILSLAILVGAIAVLGELVRAGLRSAERARDLSRATMICETVLAQVTAGLLPPDPVSATPFDANGTWQYTIDVEQTSSQELVAVRVTVARNVVSELQPVTCSLVRWVSAVYEDPSTAGSTDSSGGTTSSGTSGMGGAR